MRTVRIAVAALVAGGLLAVPAGAEQRGWNGGAQPGFSGGQRVVQNGRTIAMPPRGAPQGRPNPNRWGPKVDGRWQAGYRAPGGWAGYHHLDRGRALPRYWMSPSFFIGDYLAWGLAAPPYGYNWVRYYDDAVLVDGDGRVWDSVSGIRWDYDEAEAASYGDYSESYATAGAGYAAPGYAAPIPFPQGGAYVQPAPAYVQPVPPAYAQPAPRVVYAPPVEHVQPVPAPAPIPAPGYAAGAYGVTYSTTSYGYGGGSVTTVVIPSPPVVTTTTTVTEEVVQDTTYVTRKVHKPLRRVYRRPATCCPCGCR